MTFDQWWKGLTAADRRSCHIEDARTIWSQAQEVMRERAAKVLGENPCPGEIVRSWGYEESDPCKCHAETARKIRALPIE